MLIPTAVTFYAVALAVHIAGIVFGFGVTFAYPFMDRFVRRTDPRWLPGYHRVQEHIGKRVISPGLVVVAAAGIYLASKLHVWGSFYVQWGLAAVVVIGALGGAFYSPREKRLAELAQRDVDAAGDGPVTLSPEYESLSRQVATVGSLTDLLILVTIYFMTAQTGA